MLLFNIRKGRAYCFFRLLNLTNPDLNCKFLIMKGVYFMPRIRKIISRIELLKLQRRYKTDRAIGELFAITRQAVHQARVKLGIPPIEHPIEERNNKVQKYFTNGYKIAELMSKFNLSRSHVYRIIGKTTFVVFLALGTDPTICESLDILCDLAV
jgi:predicted DNA-binding protein YlxM (UPF0122 family)